MKTKQIFAVVLFCLFASCQNHNNAKTENTESNCIKRVLDKDSELGKLRNMECLNLELHNTIKNYVQAMRQLNFEGCNKNFKIAFKKHISAWDDMGRFTREYAHLRGEMHHLFDSIENTKDSLTFKPLLKAIWSTWSEVENAKTTSY